MTSPNDHQNLIAKIIYFYVNGFRYMKVRKKLWTIILIKLFVMFVLLKIFLFPDFLSSKSDNDEGKADYVRTELIKRN